MQSPDEWSGTVAECLSLVQPCLAPALFSREAVLRLQHAGRLLAPIPPFRIGFESRLTAGDDRIDLQQGFVGNPVTQARLAQHLEKRVAGPSAASPAWQRIRAFGTAWNDPTSPLHAHVVDFWLEFDLPDAAAAVPVPSVFFGLDQKASPARQSLPVALAASEILHGAPISPRLREELERCFDACPAGARVSHLGFMLSRETEYLRVNLKGIRGEDVLPVLQTLRWPGDRDGLQTLLARTCSVTDAFTVCLDLTPSLAPRLGFECFQSHDDPHRPARWAAFLRALVEQGLCAPEKATALQHWPGNLDPTLVAEPWPGAFVLQALREAPQHFGVINREISHVKLTCQPGRAVEAKAYFGFCHMWLKPKAPPDPAAPFSPPSSSARSDFTVSHALRDAARFLLAMRTQTGWWRTFGGSEFGPSDEWVTAYVGAALAPLADEKCRRAAAWAWTVLGERRPADEGWGFNAAAAADADSTVWALRLAQATGAGDAARIGRATEFLARHARAGGGLSTYQEDHYLAFHGLERIPAELQPWFQEHACVTAAAGALEGTGEMYSAFLRAAQRTDGRWSSYWWSDDEYATALAAEALAAGGRAEDKMRIAKAVAWALSRIGPAGYVATDAHPDGSAFATALCVRVLQFAPHPVAVQEPLARAVRWLLAVQHPDGAWSPSAVVLANQAVTPVARLADHAAVFTTATVLTALGNLPGWNDRDSARYI